MIHVKTIGRKTESFEGDDFKFLQNGTWIGVKHDPTGDWKFFPSRLIESVHVKQPAKPAFEGQEA